MSYGLEEFCADCHDNLVEDPGPEGREKVRHNLERLLSDPEEAKKLCNAFWEPGTNIIHHDTETGIYVLGHLHEKDGRRGPHDHGSSWAIYSNVSGHTDMIVWRRLDDGSEPGHAEIEPDQEYRIEPGMASLYNEGAIHSISYPAGTRLIRITGTDFDLETVNRFDPEKQLVVAHDRSKDSAAAE